MRFLRKCGERGEKREKTTGNQPSRPFSRASRHLFRNNRFS